MKPKKKPDGQRSLHRQTKDDGVGQNPPPARSWPKKRSTFSISGKKRRWVERGPSDTADGRCPPCSRPAVGTAAGGCRGRRGSPRDGGARLNDGRAAGSPGGGEVAGFFWTPVGGGHSRTGSRKKNLMKGKTFDGDSLHM